MTACASIWDAICSDFKPEWLEELQADFTKADKRRVRARFNTGSISIETGLQLRAICEHKKPDVIIEIGTFIGKSTASLRAVKHIYTCDKDNDCLPSSEGITTHPFWTSTQLLKDMAARGVMADLFFFDGRLTCEDIDLLPIVSNARAWYVFDDYHAGGKGEANVSRMIGAFSVSNYTFVEPYEAFTDVSTLAMLIPQREAQ